MPDKPERYAAVVVGAGPAGSMAAREIARHGLRVLLLEEHAAVGVPSHCSGLVTPRTLALAGVGEGVIVNSVSGAVIHTATGRELTVGGDRLHAVAIDRERFDRALVEQAQEAGAELALATKLTNLTREGGHVRLQIQRSQRACVVRTRLLIGADGAQSRVAKLMGIATERCETVVGLGAEARIKMRRRDCVEVFVGDSIAPGFFAWLIPLGDGYARLGIATNNGRRPVHYLRALMDRFPRTFAGAEILRFYGGVIPLKHAARIYDDGAMLVGDAAGQVKPTSGGGIYTALVAARVCAQAATRALARDDVSASSLSSYQRLWMETMGKELERGQDLRRLALSLSEQEIDRLLRILGTHALQSLISRYGDIDFPSRLAVQLGLSLTLPLRLVRAALPIQ